ncbi:MAG: glycerate kinase type-2 family protein [Candidatus Rokuibacteriota bacterium]
MTPREATRAIWDAALAAANVEPLVRDALTLEGSMLAVEDRAFDLRRLDRLIVLGCGKAGAAMAGAVEGALGDRIAQGLVVVKDGYTAPTRCVLVAEAGHPVPDARGQAAAAGLLKLARSAGQNDLILFLISGGGSALTPAPAPPLTLEEKQSVTRLLLSAGATINELNAVRKHLSLFKGGQLARAAWPAPVLALILSDVIGDPLDVIASGPTAPDPTTFADALAVLERRAVRERTPAAILARLVAGARGEVEETPKPGDLIFEGVTNVIVGNNEDIVSAAADAAENLGYQPYVLPRALEGEAGEAARYVLSCARGLVRPACLIAGGETTVTVRGRGRGGRCQEFALAAALALDLGDDRVVLAAGTDGTDGPTDAAGGLVDAGTLERGRAAGLDPQRALDDNDAYTFLRASGDLLVTGPTNTNLLDLYLIVRA